MAETMQRLEKNPGNSLCYAIQNHLPNVLELQMFTLIEIIEIITAHMQKITVGVQHDGWNKFLFLNCINWKLTITDTF